MAGTAIQMQQGGSLAGLDADTMNALVTGGDCSRLSPAQKTAYYAARCEAAGLDPRAQPFAFMRLNGKEVLYALKAAADQLAAKHGVRLSIVSQTTEDGIRVVTVRAEAKDGRVTEEIGALPVKGLVGEAAANALMKCVTKAKRRAVLSLCGLGMLDETEVESVPHEPVPNAAIPVSVGTYEVLPPAGRVEAPRQEAPKAVEAKPAAKPPQPHVYALWAKLLKAQGGNKKLAEVALAKAAKEAGAPEHSSDWTVGHVALIESSLWPEDVA